MAISERACVAVEAMEGTDAMLRRAASLVNGRALRLVKVSRRRGHLLFDVPVAGPGTIQAMQETGTTALAVDAGRTLLLDRDEMLAAAGEAGIAIKAYRPDERVEKVMNKLRVAVVGAGEFGRRHMRAIAQSSPRESGGGRRYRSRAGRGSRCRRIRARCCRRGRAGGARGCRRGGHADDRARRDRRRASRSRHRRAGREAHRPDLASAQRLVERRRAPGRCSRWATWSDSTPP